MYDLSTTSLIFDTIASAPTKEAAVAALQITLNAAYLKGVRDNLLDMAASAMRSVSDLDASVRDVVAGADALFDEAIDEAIEEAFAEAPEDHALIEGPEAAR